jgi:hypothetical protein
MNENNHKAITAESLQDRIDEMIRQRDEFIQKANDRIAWFNGAISVLDELLNGKPEKKQETEAT